MYKLTIEEIKIVLAWATKKSEIGLTPKEVDLIVNLKRFISTEENLV